MKDLILHFFTLPIGKRTQIALYIVQGLFSIVFSYGLYKYYLNSNGLGDVTNVSVVVEFILSGRILFFLGFFIGVWLIFYEIGFSVVVWVNKKIVIWIINSLVSWIKRKTHENNQNDHPKIGNAERILEKLGALEIEKADTVIKRKGKRYDKYLKMSQWIKTYNTEKRFLRPYIVLALITQFNLLYFISFGKEIDSFWLDFTVLSIFILCNISFFMGVFFLEIMLRAALMVENALKGVE